MNFYLFVFGRCLPFSLSYVKIGYDRIDLPQLRIQFFSITFSSCWRLLQSERPSVELWRAKEWWAICTSAVCSLRACFFPPEVVYRWGAGVACLLAITADLALGLLCNIMYCGLRRGKSMLLLLHGRRRLLSAGSFAWLCSELDLV